jgi:hypothetical protein
LHFISASHDDGMNFEGQNLTRQIAQTITEQLGKIGLRRADFVEEVTHFEMPGRSRKLSGNTCRNFWDGKNIELDTLQVVLAACDIELSIGCAKNSAWVKVLAFQQRGDLAERWLTNRGKRKTEQQRLRRQQRAALHVKPSA